MLTKRGKRKKVPSEPEKETDSETVLIDFAKLGRKVETECKVTYAKALMLVAEYARFMRLKMITCDFDAKNLSPSALVDKVWHIHLLDTREYSSMFKTPEQFVHHNPDGALENDEANQRERYKNTIRTYIQTYNEAPPPEVWPPAEEPKKEEQKEDVLPVVTGDYTCQFFMKLVDGSGASCFFNINNTVREFRKYLETTKPDRFEKDGKYNLIFRGQLMQPENTIASYGFSKEDTMWVTYSIRGC